MGDRFYYQQIEAIGSCPGDPNYTRRKRYEAKMKKRRLKKDIVIDIYSLVESSWDEKQFITEFSKLTVKALEELESILK